MSQSSTPIYTKVLRELIGIIEQHRDEIARTWDEFFGEG